MTLWSCPCVQLYLPRMQALSAVWVRWRYCRDSVAILFADWHWELVYLCATASSLFRQNIPLHADFVKIFPSEWPFKGALSRYSVIFCPIWCGKNNGGCASLQTKRAQQVSCLSIIVVHLVLYCEIHKCTWKITSLERSSDQECSRSIRGALQAGFGFHEFFTIVQGKVVFLFSLSWSYLKAQLRPWRDRDEWLCKGIWLILWRRSIAKLYSTWKFLNVKNHPLLT